MQPLGTFRVKVRHQSDGQTLVTCDSPTCLVRAPNEAEALARIRTEIRYRIEFCPCSYVTDDYVQLDVQRM